MIAKCLCLSQDPALLGMSPSSLSAGGILMHNMSMGVWPSLNGPLPAVLCLSGGGHGVDTQHAHIQFMCTSPLSLLSSALCLVSMRPTAESASLQA